VRALALGAAMQLVLWWDLIPHIWNAGLMAVAR